MAWSATWTTVRRSRGRTAFALNNEDGGAQAWTAADLEQVQKAMDLAWQLLDSKLVGTPASTKTVALTGTAGSAISITLSGGAEE